MQQTISGLQQQLATAEAQLARSKSACDHKPARIRSLLASQKVQVDATDLAHAKMIRLQQIINDQNTLLWEHKVVCDQFDHVKELIHQMVAAGGLQMVVSVLFVGTLAHFGGIDLAGLEIDHLKFATYFDYALAMTDGLPCALLPQGM